MSYCNSYVFWMLLNYFQMTTALEKERSAAIYVWHMIKNSMKSETDFDRNRNTFRFRLHPKQRNLYRILVSTSHALPLLLSLQDATIARHHLGRRWFRIRVFLLLLLLVYLFDSIHAGVTSDNIDYRGTMKIHPLNDENRIFFPSRIQLNYLVWRRKNFFCQSKARFQIVRNRVVYNWMNHRVAEDNDDMMDD